MRKLGRGMAVAATAAASLAIAACGSDSGDDGTGGSARKGGAITIAQTSQPDYLDPALAYTLNAWEALWLVYTPPVTYKHEEGAAGTELTPGLADALPEVSNGGKTYKFTLRKGLKYSDGRPVKASDFEHTIKRVLNLESGGAAFYEGIVGAEDYEKAAKPEEDIKGIETDDRTGAVTINLNEPDGSFRNVLAMDFAGIVPGDTPFKNLSSDPPAGVGSYKITKSVPNREFVMEKNANFDIPGIPKGNIDTITTKIVKNANRQAQDVIGGKLDYMQDPPPADILPEVRAQYKDRYEEHVTGSTYYFFMNQRVKPFDKREVREAVNHAVDSKALARLFGGRLEPGCNFLPPGMTGYEKVDPCPWGDPAGRPDLDRARQLIREAGEEGTEVTVWGNNDENRPEITEYYADVLNQIGLEAKPKIVDGGVYFATIGNEKTRAQTGFHNWFNDFPHPANFMFLVDGKSIQPTNNQNFSNVDDPKINAAIERLKQEPDLKKVAGEWAEVDKMVVDGAHQAPYGHEKLATFMSERMDFENCSSFHFLYYNDYSSFCLK